MRYMTYILTIPSLDYLHDSGKTLLFRGQLQPRRGDQDFSTLIVDPMMSVAMRKGRKTAQSSYNSLTSLQLS